MKDWRWRLGRRVVAAAALVLATVLGGCGDGAGGGVSGGTALPTDAIVVAMQGDAQSLDPHMVGDAPSMRMIENMYATLLRYTPTYGEYAPDLATDVAVSDDGLTYTITLNPDARFHSGRPVTAADVKYSLERIKEQGLRKLHFRAVERIDTPDEHTVVLHLSEPMGALRSYLAHPMNAIVDRTAVEADGVDLRNRSAGAGPYRLALWRRGQELMLEAHEAYHVDGLPKTPRLVYRPIGDESARSMAARAGEVHVVHEVPARDVQTLEDADGLAVVSSPGTFWEYIGLNTRRPPLDDPRVRQAIAWAVDRDQLNAAVKLGQATPLRAANLPPHHWAALDETIYPQRDIEKARALLAEAGHEDGIDLTLLVDSSVDYQVRAAEMIKQHLAPAGIDVSVQAMETTAFFDKLGAGEFDATVVGWMGFVDPDQWMYDLFHSEGQYNQQGFSDAEVDQLLEQGRRLPDRRAVTPIYQEAQRRVAELAPMVFLYVNPQTSAVRDEVEGYVVHPTATTIFLRDATVEGAED